MHGHGDDQVNKLGPVEHRFVVRLMIDSIDVMKIVSQRERLEKFVVNEQAGNAGDDHEKDEQSGKSAATQIRWKKNQETPVYLQTDLGFDVQTRDRFVGAMILSDGEQSALA